MLESEEIDDLGSTDPLTTEEQTPGETPEDLDRHTPDDGLAGTGTDERTDLAADDPRRDGDTV